MGTHLYRIWHGYVFLANVTNSMYHANLPCWFSSLDQGRQLILGRLSPMASLCRSVGDI